MTSFPRARPGACDLISSIAFEDFQVSWAGGCPPGLGDFCFGSEDGRVVFTNADGAIVGKLEKECLSGEAVNGVAFSQQWMSVSSRKEITLWRLSTWKGVTGATFPIGAHGVVAGSNGYFFAPAGRAGLVFFRPKDGPEQNVTISTSDPEPIYLYRLIALTTSSGPEAIGCASRQSGVAVMEFLGEDRIQKMNTMSFNGLDVVDLCPLSERAKSMAAAAMGKDGTIILFRNLLHDLKPGTIKFQTIQGTAYRILCARGYLFLLTSEGIYVIAGLIEHFLKGAAGNPEVQVLPLPMEAVDANLAGDKWLLIVMPDGVLRLDLDVLDRSSPSNFNGKVREMQPITTDAIWSRRGVEQHSRPVLLGT